MKSFNCANAPIRDINSCLVWSAAMNVLKKTAIGLSIVATTAFSAQAQTSDDNLLTFNGASKAKTEAMTKAVANALILKKGSSGEARTVSMKYNALVLHVSGGTKDKYSAEAYAKMLQIMFNDPKRTDYPTKISVLFEESGDDLPTGVFAFINGYKFDKNGGGYYSGDGVFTAAEIVKWIPQITKQHATVNGTTSLEKSTDGKSLVMN